MTGLEAVKIYLMAAPASTFWGQRGKENLGENMKKNVKKNEHEASEVQDCIFFFSPFNGQCTMHLFQE